MRYWFTDAELNGIRLRQHSPWLVFAISFFLVSSALALTLLRTPINAPLIDNTGGSLAPPWSEYQSPQRCRECHPTEFEMWSNTTHARALFDPIFQTYLHQMQQPGECFACHATGYDTTTGQFVLAGVTCEACHGPYRAEHPRQSMAIATSDELCGNCHPSTLAEWQMSRHGANGVTCVNCHEVHTQQTHAAASTNQLCATCHRQNIQDDTHAIHQSAQVHCIDCHLARPEDDGSGAINGHAVTGHSFEVFVKTCTDCHAAAVSGLVPVD